MSDGNPRRLVLVRHAKSAWPDGVPDRERPLSPRGIRQAPLAGRWLRTVGYLPDIVVCSTARRARETWDLANRQIGASPFLGFDERVYGGQPPGLLDVLREAPRAARTVLLVGHNPGLQQLAVLLAGDAAGHAGRDALARLRAKLPTGAVVVLETDSEWPGLRPDGARLTAFVTPRDLESTAEHDDAGRQPP